MSAVVTVFRHASCMQCDPTPRPSPARVKPVLARTSAACMAQRDIPRYGPPVVCLRAERLGRAPFYKHGKEYR